MSALRARTGAVSSLLEANPPGRAPAVVLVSLLALGACAASGSPGPEPTEPPATTVAGLAPTTSATAPPATSTTEPSTVVDDAEGSGCTPGPRDLPDGEWFGYLVDTPADAVEFDLACWFTGEAAVRAAQTDGAESPPPNDYYVRNDNPAIRRLNVAEQASVVWYPEFGDPTSEATTSYADWLLGIEDRGSMPGVWLQVDDGQVSAIHEQWVP